MERRLVRHRLDVDVEEVDDGEVGGEEVEEELAMRK